LIRGVVQIGAIIPIQFGYYELIDLPINLDNPDRGLWHVSSTPPTNGSRLKAPPKGGVDGVAQKMVPEFGDCIRSDQDNLSSIYLDNE
jgi:hypothetical protein